MQEFIFEINENSIIVILIVWRSMSDKSDTSGGTLLKQTRVLSCKERSINWSYGVKNSISSTCKHYLINLTYWVALHAGRDWKKTVQEKIWKHLENENLITLCTE